MVVLLAYASAWLLFEALSVSYAGTQAASPWHPGASLSFFLMYAFGEGFAFAPILVEVLRGLLFGHQPPIGYGALLSLGVVASATYGSAAFVLRRVLRVRMPFRGLRDLLWYLVVGCAIAPVLAGAGSTLVLSFVGATPWGAFFSQFATASVGDAIGMLVIAPALGTFLTPLLATEREDDGDHLVTLSIQELGACMLAIVIGAIVGYWLLGVPGSAPVYFFLFLPLIWMAGRAGLPTAIIGILTADLAVVILNAWFRLPTTQSLAYQAYIATSALTALALGAVITQRRRDERAALDRARRDPNTNIPSPQALDAWLSHPRARTYPALTLLLVAIDNMRWVNEGLRRSAVDDFMRGVAERLQSVNVRALFVAHVDNHEFAVLLDGEDRNVAAIAAEKIRRAFERPLPADEAEIYASVSVGIATCTGYADDPRLLVPHAERALDAAHSRGFESIAFHQAQEDREPLYSLAAQLHHALSRGEFDLWYQPLFAPREFPDPRDPMQGARIVGAEALLRWNHPQRGTIGPDSFLDMLDSMSLCERVGGWQIDTALGNVARWRRAGHDIAVWLNVFGRQLFDPEFFGSLRGRLLKHGVTSSSVVVEITERMIAREETEVVAIVDRLRSAGIRVAIDDFGTGHSTLSRLRNIPFDIVKIDQSFVRGLEGDARSGGVVTTLINLARDLDATIVAEGIESDGQLDFLVRHGCRVVQGFRLALPMPAHEFESLLRRTNVAR